MPRRVSAPPICYGEAWSEKTTRQIWCSITAVIGPNVPWINIVTEQVEAFHPGAQHCKNIRLLAGDARGSKLHLAALFSGRL